MDKKEFQEKLDEIHNGKIEIISEYKNSQSPADFKCRVCKHKWTVKYPCALTRTKRPTGCPKCSNNLPVTNESFDLMLEDDYKRIGNVEKSSKPVDVLHIKCGKVYPVRPNDYQQGYRCPYCSHGHTKKTQQEFENDVAKATDIKNEYSVIGKYDGCSKPVDLIHNVCGCVFPVKPTNFLSNGTRCPECATKQSKGCKKIISVFNKLNIEYNTECKLENLKDKRLLRVDFYIKKLKLYIEFDGKQHFYPQPKFGGETYLKECRKKDSIKNSYFLENDLNLLRIDDNNYSKFEKILKNIINNNDLANKDYNVYLIKDGKLIIDNSRYDIFEKERIRDDEDIV